MRRSDLPTRAATSSGSEDGEPAREEWLFCYDLFEGWRWEQRCSGVLVAESRHNFESRHDCMRDAGEHRRRALAGPRARRVH